MGTAWMVLFIAWLLTMTALLISVGTQRRLRRALEQARNRPTP